MTTVGDRLREARRRRFLTQHGLSAVTGISPTTIARIESSGAPDFPRTATIRKLADALEIDPGWLLFGDEPFLPMRQLEIAR